MPALWFGEIHVKDPFFMLFPRFPVVVNEHRGQIIEVGQKVFNSRSKFIAR